MSKTSSLSQTDCQTELCSTDICVDQLIQAFRPGDASSWSDLQFIRSTIRDIRNAADEASECLEPYKELDGQLSQADRALTKLKMAIHKLSSLSCKR